MKLPVLNLEGKEVRQITVDESVFGIAPNTAVLHQAFVAQRANQRRGSASTKGRSEVQGSTRKIRSQKYTGRARQGSSRSPTRVGGGVAFGPKPRSYKQALPKKMKRLAIRSALSGKLADGQLRVVDKLEFDRPRTKDMLRVLRNVGIERSALIVTGEPDRTVLASARNIEKTKVLPAAYLNVVDMLGHRDLLLTEDAVRRVEGLWAGGATKPAPTEAPRRARRKPAEEQAAVVEEAPAEEAKPARRARRPKAETAPAPGEEAKPARRPRKPTAEAESADEKPARRTARRPKAEEPPAESTEKPRLPARQAGATRRRSSAKKEEEA